MYWWVVDLHVESIVVPNARRCHVECVEKGSEFVGVAFTLRVTGPVVNDVNLIAFPVVVNCH